MDWSEIKKVIGSLRQLDKQLAVFGSNTHKYQDKKTLSDEEISRVETKNNCLLPLELKNYYKIIGNGVVGPAYGIYSIDEIEFINAHVPYKGVESYLTELEEEGIDPYLAGYYQIPEEKWGGLVKVNHEGCSSHLAIVCTGVSKDTVVWFNYDGQIYETGLNFRQYYAEWLMKEYKKFLFIKQSAENGLKKSKVLQNFIEEYEEHNSEKYINSYLDIKEKLPEIHIKMFFSS